MVWHAIGKNHDSGNVGGFDILEQLDTFEQTVPKISSVNGSHARDILPGTFLVLAGHGKKRLHNLGFACKRDYSQTVALVHCLDDGAGGMFGEIQDG